MKHNPTGARTEGLVGFSWKQAGGRRPQNKQAATSGRSLNARHSLLSIVTVQPCLYYKKSRWTVILLLVRQNILENASSYGYIVGLLVISMQDDSFLLHADCKSALSVNGLAVTGQRSEEQLKFCHLNKPLGCLTACQGQRGQQEYRVCHQGHAHVPPTMWALTLQHRELEIGMPGADSPRVRATPQNNL